MLKTTKLNGSIRALYKSKARQKLHDVEVKKRDGRTEEMQRIIKQFESAPHVKSKLKLLAELSRQQVAIKERINHLEAEIRTTAGASYYESGGKPVFNGFTSYVPDQFRELVERYEKARNVERQITCQCGDTPELIEFMANLSLCKTVGDAETLLDKLGKN